MEVGDGSCWDMRSEAAAGPEHEEPLLAQGDFAYFLSAAESQWWDRHGGVTPSFLTC